MSTATTRPPKLPPPWFIHTFWRVHRALYRLSRGRFLQVRDWPGLCAAADFDATYLHLRAIP